MDAVNTKMQTPTSKRKLAGKLRWPAAGLALFAFLAVLIFPGSRAVLYGWLRMEPRFHGLPASYWSVCLRRDYAEEVHRVRGQPNLWEQVQQVVGYKQPARIRKLPPLRPASERPAGMPELPFGDPVPSARTRHFAIDSVAALPRQSPAQIQGQGATAPDAIPVLTSLLHDTDPAVRADAAQALALVGTAPQTTIDALALALKDEDQDVRCNAAWALGMMGGAARCAVRELRAAINDVHEIVSCAAEIALWRIDPLMSAPSQDRLHDPGDRG